MTIHGMCIDDGTLARRAAGVELELSTEGDLPAGSAEVLWGDDEASSVLEGLLECARAARALDKQRWNE